MKAVEILKDTDLKNSKLLWYGVTTLIFAVLLYFVDINQFLNALRDADRKLMGLALISGLSLFLFVSYVWHRTFNRIGIKTDYRTSLRLYLAGNFLNSITPLGQFGGEPFMAYIVSRSTGESYEKALSGVVSADMINAVPLVTYMSAGLIYLTFYSTLDGFTTQIIYVMTPLILAGLLLAYILWFRTGLLENMLFGIVDRLEKKLQRGEKYIESVKDRIREVKNSFKIVGEDPVHLSKTLAIPHLAIITQFTALYLVLLSQGVEAYIIPTVFVVILSTVATFSPTPGGSGTFETAFSGLLMLFYPVTFDTALASAVLFRLTTYWPGIAIGYIALLNLKRENR